MSSGQRIKKHPQNRTIIKNGRIIRIDKDSRIKSDLGPYLVKHKRSQ